MKILIVGMLHAYGDPKREYSFEYFNFFHVLQELGHEVEYFDYMGEIKAYGKAEMNVRLLQKVCEFQPKLVIISLYTDQFEVKIINALRDHTTTFCFFHDDTWRIEYSRYWARQFDYFSTPDLRGDIKYGELHLANAIYFPFGCNEKIFRKIETKKIYDVTFVGSWHPYREWLIRKIRKAGIAVEAIGYGWPNGEINQEGMVRIFSETKINLNLTNSASWDARYLASSPRGLINRVRSKKNVEQMKARIFEISGCGSFQISYFVEGLANCYEIDREISVYSDVDDLITKIKFFLKHSTLRESMADAAMARTLLDHTYARRFKIAFTRMGLFDE